MNYIFKFDKDDYIEAASRKQNKTGTHIVNYISKEIIEASSFKMKIEHMSNLWGKDISLRGHLESGEIRMGDSVIINGKEGKVEKIKSGVASLGWTEVHREIEIWISHITKEDIYKQMQSQKDSESDNIEINLMTDKIEGSNNEEIFAISRYGVFFEGKILKGTISVGDKVKINGKEGIVSSIEKSGNLIEVASIIDGDVKLNISSLKEVIPAIIKSKKENVNTVQMKERTRTEMLKEFAESVAKKTAKSGVKYTLEAMNSDDRRVIHEHLKNNPDVKTYSVGEEPFRKVVIERTKSKGD